MSSASGLIGTTGGSLGRFESLTSWKAYRVAATAKCLVNAQKAHRLSLYLGFRKFFIMNCFFHLKRILSSGYRISASLNEW
jgi:hypothetical protein